MPCFYFKPANDDLIPELQVYLVEALYEVSSVMGGPRGLHERRACDLTQPDRV